MRIIAGEYRSRVLKTLEGMQTRPTQDKIKEAMFSSLGAFFSSGTMLDLFAGSGSVGLESISRGMSEVYFCDDNRDAIKIIKDNISLLKVEQSCHVYHLDYKLMLEKCKNMSFDFIFIDPPYANKVFEECIQFIQKHNMLTNQGVLVIESSIEDSFEEQYGDLIKIKEKEYRLTRLTYFKKGIK